MSGKAILKSLMPVDEGKSLRVSLEFEVNGVKYTVNETTSGNIARLEQYCRNQIAMYEDAQAHPLTANMTIVDTALDSPKPGILEPTAGELARQAWLADYAKLQQMKIAVSQEILAEIDEALKKKVRDNFLVEYLPYINRSM